MSVFLSATKSDWYAEFLQPVIEELSDELNTHQILDVGTGPGTLPHMILSKNPKWRITGTDISEKWIDIAKKANQNEQIEFVTDQSSLSTFKDNIYDTVIFCSVLFLTDEETTEKLLKEAIRIVQKKKGKIIILTPSGLKTRISAIGEWINYPMKPKNQTYLIWKMVTKKRGQEWRKKRFAKKIALQNGLKHREKLVFNNNAIVEVLEF